MIAVVFAYITLRYHLIASNMLFIWPLQLIILLLAIKSLLFLRTQWKIQVGCLIPSKLHEFRHFFKGTFEGTIFE